MKKLLMIFTIFVNTQLQAQHADPALTGAIYVTDQAEVGSNSELQISFVNAGFSDIPAYSVEMTISTPVHYSSDGVNEPFGEGATYFDWTYLGNDVWRGLNNKVVPSFQGGSIQMTVMGLINSNSYEVSNLNVQAVDNLSHFSDQSANNNLQPGLKISGQGVLPVVWSSFDVENMDNHHLVEWLTSQEVQAQHYEVLRAKENATFEMVAKVEAHGANKKYEYIDRDIESAGFYYYRIKQVDLDGKYSFSDIKTIFRNRSNQDFKLFPNPTVNIANIKGAFDNEVLYTIFLLNSDGSMVSKTNTNVKNNQLQLDLSSYNPGIYYIMIYDQNNGLLTKQKVIRI